MFGKNFKQPKKKKRKAPTRKAKKKVARKSKGKVDLAAINKQLKAERAVSRLGDSPLVVETVDIGLYALHQAIGIPGLPRGRAIEVFGPESGGKTTLALQFIAAYQRQGYTCAFIDAEHALDPVWAEKIGVDVDNLYYSQPDSAEQAIDIVRVLAKSGKFDLIVIDSVSALVPQVELDTETEKQQMGLQARLMSKAMRQTIAPASKSGCTVVWINQIRMKIGVVYGNPETTSGGRALKFAASLRMRVSAKKSDFGIQECIVNVVKNKLARPFVKASLIIGTDGFSKGYDLKEIGKELEVIERRGNSYFFDGDSIASSDKSLTMFLEKKSKVRGKIRKAIRRALEDGY